MRLPVEGLIKKTIFHQFCGGESQQECLPVVKKIHKMNVHTVFDYASEIREKGEAAFDKDLQNQIEIADFAAQHKEIPFLAIKPTNLGGFKIWAKVSSGEDMSAEEKKAWENIKRRFNTLSRHVYNLGLRLQVDAEETWTQKA